MGPKLASRSGASQPPRGPSVAVLVAVRRCGLAAPTRPAPGAKRSATDPTGLRWGELVALRPRHVDSLRRSITVEETIVEVSRKDSPTGERMIVKAYPKNDE